MEEGVTMSGPAKIHFRNSDFPRVTICGKKTPPLEATKDRDRLTCGMCVKYLGYLDHRPSNTHPLHAVKVHFRHLSVPQVTLCGGLINPTRSVTNDPVQTTCLRCIQYMENSRRAGIL